MKKYQVIYADPPWMYQDKSKSHGGGAESHYPCMSIKDICALPIHEIAEDNSVLLMWATMPMLEEAFKVIKAWGFKYKTCAFTWVKTNRDGTIYMGMGRHTRQNAELCLLATRGKGVKRERADIYSSQLHGHAEHSKKPPTFRKQIVQLYGNVSRIELFSRKENTLMELEDWKGWDVWGNEVESDITL